MKNLFTLFVVLITTQNAFSQWNNDETPFRVTNIGYTRQENVKTVRTADNKTYIAYTKSGHSGVDVWLQLLDSYGHRMFGSEGIKVNSSVSPLYVSSYGITTDNEGNATIIFADQRQNPADMNNVAYLYKVDKTGHMLLGTEGVKVATTAKRTLKEQIFLINGTVVAVFDTPLKEGSYTSVSNIELVGNDGKSLTGGAITLGGDNASLYPTSDGFIAVYIKDSKAYAQRYNMDGKAVWSDEISLNNDVTVTGNDSGTTFEGGTDGEDGALIVYEATDNKNNPIYLMQHIKGDGVVFSASNIDAGIPSYGSKYIKVDAQTQSVYAFWKTSGQPCQLRAKKMNYNGDALWKQTADVDTAENNMEIYDVGIKSDGNITLTYVCNPDYATDNLCQAELSVADGRILWRELLRSSSSLAYVDVNAADNVSYIYFTEAPSSTEVGVAGMRVFADGSLGKKFDLDVNVTQAGTLSTLVPEDMRHKARSLRIKGVLNGSDVKFIRDMSGVSSNDTETDGILSDIDFSDVSIVEGGEAYASYFSWDTYEDVDFKTENNVFPAHFFSAGNNGGCSVTSIVLPKTIMAIGDQAFQNCGLLTDLYIPESVQKLGNKVFYGSGITSMVVPSGVVSVGNGTFFGCANLKSVALNCGIKTIPSTCFSQTGLKEIYLPTSVTKIADGAFHFCYDLERINGLEHVTDIGSLALNYCSSMKYIQLSDSLLTIGAGALANMRSLETLYIPASVKNITNSYIYGASFIGNTSLKAINVDEANEFYRSIDGVLYTKDGAKLIACPTGYVFNDSTFTVPEGVVDIDFSAFEMCLGLQIISLPSTLVNIGNSAFGKCHYINYITVSAAVPPMCGIADPFDYVDKASCALYVPTGSEQDYKVANVWKDFKLMNASGVTLPTIKRHDCRYEYFDLNGRKVTRDYRGIVVRFGYDGSVRKILNH